MDSEEEPPDRPTRHGIGFKSKVKSCSAAAVTLVREFLETSTLHGLVYISKAESVWGKILWTISVILSFSLAVVLINISFANWAAQPVSSVISTHSVRNLKFPNVTICPPKGSNTALNYDLLRLRKTFNTSEKEQMVDDVRAIFTENARQGYFTDLLQVVGLENLKRIYQGFQTMPTHLNGTGFKVKLSGSAGEISTPSLKYYPIMLYVLTFPDNLDQLVGKPGKLILELQIATEGKQDIKVEYISVLNS